MITSESLFSDVYCNPVPYQTLICQEIFTGIQQNITGAYAPEEKCLEAEDSAMTLIQSHALL